MPVRLKYATILDKCDHILTTFEDGASSANWLPQDDGNFVRIARDCGFLDPYRYLAAHEVVHSLAPEVMFDRPGYVVWMAAHGRKANLAAAMMEERMFYYIQRAACDAIPCIDPQWHEVIERLRRYDMCGDAVVAHMDRLAA